MRGWRLEVFGNDAVALCSGKIALTAVGNDVKVVQV
jgi:ribonuclease D